MKWGGMIAGGPKETQGRDSLVNCSEMSIQKGREIVKKPELEGEFGESQNDLSLKWRR